MRGKKLHSSEGENGVVLVVCLILLLMLSLIGIASITTSTSDMQVAGNEMKQTGAFYAAESGLETAAAAIATSYETNGVPPSPLPNDSTSEGEFVYFYDTIDQGAAVQTTLTDGSYKGLYGLVKTFNITSTGFDNNQESAVRLNMQMQDVLVPLFQFAVFYQNHLEIAPGPNMTLSGRVHSNANIYLQSESNLNIDSYLTSAGDILHGRMPGSGQGVASGNVFIRDNAGTYQNMKNSDGTWLDSRSSNWVDNSLARWNGRVEDSNHGITELYMPVVTDGPATDLIDRGSTNDDSFENKAGLKFVDEQALYLQTDGSWIDVTSTLITQGVISAASFYDAREMKNVTALDLDIGLLAASGYYPQNGIIYGSLPTNEGIVSAIRLKNAATLPSALTLATDNPLYTKGSFNTVVKKPAALMADALTILSGNWNDANSSRALSNRIATATQVNASLMIGHVETGSNGNGYSGGLENLPRFLEKWNGVTFNWRGAMVDLWFSRQAVGAWSYGAFYTAPNRDWAFDTDLLNIANLPPGTPMVNIVQRTKWNQQVYSARSPY